MPNINKIQINNVTYDLGSNEDIYSTTEQVIGTWIDGKPLYRKVISTYIPAISNSPNVNVTIPHNITNLKEITNNYASLKDTVEGDIFLIPILGGSGGLLTIFGYDNTNIKIRANNCGFPSNNRYFITLVVEYTKTTDTVE